MSIKKRQREHIKSPGLKEEWQFFKFAVSPFKCQFIFVLVMLAGVLAASCASPVLQKHLVDAFNGRDRYNVIFFGVMAAAALVAWRGGETLWNLMATMLKIKCGAHLKRKFFHHLLQLPLGVVESGGSGYLGQRVHLDIETVSAFFCNGFFGLTEEFNRNVGF